MWPLTLDFEILLIFSLCIIGAFFIIGYPLFTFFKKIINYKEINSLQKLNYIIFFGMISVTIISSLVSALFGAYFNLTIITLFVVGLIFFIRDIWNKRSSFFVLKARDLISSYLPFFIALTVILVLSFNLVIGLVGSVNADSAYHTFFIRCILDNSKVIDRALPYYGYLLYHPPASHIIGAATQIITTFPIEKLVLLLTATCAVLTVLSLFSLTKAVFKNKWMPVIASGILIFCWFFWHPMSFTFTVSLSAFSIISTMSLSVHMCKNFQKKIIPNAILSSLLLSFSFYLHPVAFVYNLTWLLALFIINLIIFFSRYLSASKYIDWSKIKKLFLVFILGLGLVVLFTIPFINTTYTFMTSSTSGLPPDWIIPSERETFQTPISTPYYEPTGSLVDIFYLSNFATNHGAFLYLGPLSIIFIFSTTLLILLRRKAKENVDHNSNSSWTKWINLSKWGTIFFIQFELILVFLKYLYKIEFSFLGFSANTWFEYLLDPVRSWEMLYVPLLLLTCVTFYFIFLTLKIIKNTLKIKKITIVPRFSRFYKKNMKIPVINIKGIIILISFCIVISQTLLSYQSGIGNYLTWPPKTYDRAYTYIRQYSLLTTDDIKMFEWIEINTSKEDVFLVSQLDTGQYLTSVTGRKSIFPYGPLAGSRNYRILIFDIESDPCNPNILPLLRSYNIIYVYVGSKSFDPTAPTWKEAVQHNAIFNADGLIQSPIFELVNKIGDSYLFKVNSENYLEFAGPTVSVFTNSLIIENESEIGSWETNFAENEKNDFPESQSITFTSKFQLLFNFKQPIDLSKMNYFCFSARSSTQNVYRLSIYDIDENYIYWDYTVSANSSFIILNFNSSSEKNENNISLQNITKVEIELSPGNTLNKGDSSEINFNIGPVILSKQLIKTNLIELYDANKSSSQWVMNLKDYENYTLLLPNFLSLTDVEPKTISTKAYPASIIFVGAKNVNHCKLSFQLTSDDLRAINSNFISRPVRNMALQINNATANITFSQKSNIVLFEGKSLELILSSSQMCILRSEGVLVNNGKILLGVFIDGQINGSRDAVIGIYRTLSEAESHQNFITEFQLHEVHRLLLFAEEVKDLSSLYLRIDSLDVAGNFTLSINLQSYGKFY